MEPSTTVDEQATLRIQVDSAPGVPVKWDSLADVVGWLKGQAGSVAGKASAWLLAYTDFTVAWGEVGATRISTALPADEILDLQYLMELRLFGLDGEWHIWRDGVGFRGRLRVETTSELAGCIEEHQALWGSRTAPGSEPGWTTVEEDRGVKMEVPHTGFRLSADEPLRLRVRHILGVEPGTHLTTIVDSRLVALCDASGRVLPWAGEKKEG